MAIKLLSLNVERDSHLAKVLRLVNGEQADVVALMEVRECDLDLLLPDYKARVFVPDLILEGGVRMGVVVAVKKRRFEREEIFYCDGLERAYLPKDGESGVHRPGVVVVEVGGYRIGATHFTWTPNASVTPKQTKHLETLLAKFASQELVLCGDFNIPRGNANYQRLASVYLDNIPPSVKTTIDWNLHRASKEGKEKIEVVVDYVWTTPRYHVNELKIVSAVSDHMALVATVA